MAETSASSPAPAACPTKPTVPMRRNPNIQNTVDNIIAPSATAPIGAACPICPTTPTSTAPRIGTVAFDKTMGKAIRRTRPCVSGWGCCDRFASVTALRHHEMTSALRKQPCAIVLPRLNMDARITTPFAIDPSTRIRVSWQSRPQVIRTEINGFR